MGISTANIRSAVASAFAALGDIPQPITYRRTTNTYNAATGTNTVTNSNTLIADAVFAKFEKFEVDKISILATDQKCLFQASRLSIAPDVATDYILDRADVKYNIVRVNKDPTESVYILQLRAV